MTRCLIIEDQDISREVFAEHLKSLGFEAVPVSNAEEAAISCRDTMPDCILLDWHMPGVDGVEFLKILRDMRNGKKPVVIMCTCDDLVAQKQGMRDIGVNAFLTKPLTYDVLKNELSALGFL